MLVVLCACNREEHTITQEETKVEDSLINQKEMLTGGNTDSYFWRLDNIALSEEGYYICQYDIITVQSSVAATVNGFQVFFFDWETKESVPWCDRVDCNHKNIYCDSFFENEKYIQKVFYYNNRVYMISFDEDYYYLTSFDKAGKDEKTICTIGLISELNLDSCFRIVNNKIYYQKKDEKWGYYCKALSGGNETKLFEIDDAYAMSSTRLMIFEDSIFYGLSDENNNKTTIYKYTFKNKNSELLVKAEEILRDSYIIDNAIYYFSEGRGIVKYDITTNQSDIIYKTNKTGLRLSFDGEYIFLDNSSAAGDLYFDPAEDKNKDPDNINTYIIKLSINGEVNNTYYLLDAEHNRISNETAFPISFFGDTKCFFVATSEVAKGLFALDKTSTNEGEWYTIRWDREGFDYTVGGINSWTGK